ncbi:glycosyltransferase [Streptacidiphilus sp. 4-A2]|nr:glycosyltransferase [Streptacidiphilus sp. 4-A2]
MVAHDGARWLPQALRGLLAQDRPASGSSLPTPARPTRARSCSPTPSAPTPSTSTAGTGFGTAVKNRARHRPAAPRGPALLHHRGRLRPVGSSGNDQFGDPSGTTTSSPPTSCSGRLHERSNGCGLLHDDCEPSPTPAQLLQVAETTPTPPSSAPSSAAGTTAGNCSKSASASPQRPPLDRPGRREQDQGQPTRSAGALVSTRHAGRRDVFEEIGGFDKACRWMRDDVDLCWRVAAAGHRTVVAPDAAVRHAEAASRERRPIDCARPATRTASTRPARSSPCSPTPAACCCPTCCCG